MEPETFEPWKKTTPEHYDSFDGVGVHSISFGERHFLVLMDNKSVYSWGCNESGQLGHGSLDRAKTPKHIEALMGASIDRVAAGADYSLALSKTGMVYAWGNGSRGNLAINFDTIEENIFINKETQVVLVPWMVESLSDKRVQKIAAGGIVSLFLCGSSHKNYSKRVLCVVCCVTFYKYILRWSHLCLRREHFCSCKGRYPSWGYHQNSSTYPDPQYGCRHCCWRRLLPHS
jgi:alpha-tubulin suppressor-like RCC1 family protein